MHNNTTLLSSRALPHLKSNKLYKKMRHFIQGTILPLSAVLLLSLTLFACKSKPAADNMGSTQPMLDSAFVVNYIKSEPRFKNQLIWAKRFYGERKYKLGWFKNNQLVPQARQLLDVIKQSGDEGLNPADYQVKDFSKLFTELEAMKDTSKFRTLQKDLDVALSATYFTWASDYYRGLVIPKEHRDVEWDVKGNKIKLHKALMTVLGERKSK